jgi:hypothetical protein
LQQGHSQALLQVCLGILTMPLHLHMGQVILTLILAVFLAAFFFAAGFLFFAFFFAMMDSLSMNFLYSLI